MILLDTVVPEHEVWERHAVALPVAPERALELALATPAPPDWIVRTLAIRPFSGLVRRRWLQAIARQA